MDGSAGNPRSSSFSSRLDEKLSDLTSALVGPNTAYCSQQWIDAGVRYQIAGDDNNNSDAAYHDHPFLSATVRTDDTNHFDKENIQPQPQETSAVTAHPTATATTRMIDSELLKSKRAAAMASLSLKRNSGNGEAPSHLNDGLHPRTTLQSTTTTGSKATDNMNRGDNTTSVAANFDSKSDSQKSFNPVKESGKPAQSRAAPRETDKALHPSHRASTDDIEELLAEGRVATNAIAVEKSAARFVDRSNTCPSMEKARASSRNSNQQGQPPSGNDTTGDEICSALQGILAADDQEASPTARQQRGPSLTSRHSDKGTLQRQRSDPRPAHRSPQHPERPLYEPPKRSAEVFNKRPPVRANASDRDQTLHRASSTRSNFDNEFARFEENELEDLRMWLNMTGYYDVESRHKKLDRYRLKAALKQQLANLEKEEQADEEASSSRHDLGSFVMPSSLPLNSISQSIAPSSDKLSPAPRNMPPPISARNNGSHHGMSRHFNSREESEMGFTNDPPADHVSRHFESPTPKRQYSDLEKGDYQERGSKRPRGDIVSDTHDVKHDAEDTRQRGNDVPEFMSSDRHELIQREICYKDDVEKERAHAPAGPSNRPRANHNDGYSSNWVEQNNPRERSMTHWRGRGRGRGGYHGGSHRFNENGAAFKARQNEPHANGPPIDLSGDGVRYFMIKSKTPYSVEASQQEGTWVTQKKNLEMFAEAFNTCHHVIFLFSVNQSRAFQGYARMESLPGEKGVPLPSWAENTGWSDSPPFRVRWLSTNETWFKFVGHLSNSFLEDKPVLFGRDGTEIEPNCAYETCRIIDDPKHAPSDIQDTPYFDEGYI